MMNRVAEDILHRAVKQLLVAGHDSRPIDSEVEAAATGRGLESTIGNHLAEQTVETQLRWAAAVRIPLDPGKLEHFIDQVIEPVGFPSDPPERRIDVRTRPHKFHRKFEPREW